MRRRAAAAVAGVAVAAGVAGLLVTTGPDDGATPEGAVATTTVARFASFEDNARTWTTPGGRQSRVQSRSAPHGDRVLQVLHGGPVAGTRVTRGAIGVRTHPGETYRVSVRLRMANGRSAGARVVLSALEVVPDGVTRRRWRSDALALGPRFRVLSVRTGPARGDGRLVLALVHLRPRAGTGFHVDAVTVTRRADPPHAIMELDAAPEELPYDPIAAFNRPIREDAPLHPRSAQIVRDLQENLDTRTLDASIDGEVPPVHVASAHDPFYRVRVGGREERIRVPRDARAGSGADYPLIVLNPTHPDHGPHVELRVWQATVDHEARHIRGSGTGLFHYNNDGERLNPDASRSESLPFAGQGTGSGLSYLAGLVRPGEVEAGRIRHAIRVAWGCNDFTAAFRAPAVRTDQRPGRCGDAPTPGEGRVDMGMRLRLDPSVDCDARSAPMPPGHGDAARETRFLRIVCRALQEFGMIILDGTVADGLVVYLEDDATAGWRDVAGRPLYGGYGWVLRDRAGRPDGISRTAIHGIPWSRMQVLR